MLVSFTGWVFSGAVLVSFREIFLGGKIFTPHLDTSAHLTWPSTGSATDPAVKDEEVDAWWHRDLRLRLHTGKSESIKNQHITSQLCAFLYGIKFNVKGYMIAFACGMEMVKHDKNPFRCPTFVDLDGRIYISQKTCGHP